jgi:light-independent protochlorophyllide reductase subunit L
MCIEAGGPPAGTGCGGYVVGQTVKLLKQHHLLEDTDVVLFDVLGTWSAVGSPRALQHADRALIVTANDFDSIYAMNRIIAAVRRQVEELQRAAGGMRRQPLEGHRRGGSVLPRPHRLQAHRDTCRTYDAIRRSRLKKKTLFEMPDDDDIVHVRGPNTSAPCETSLQRHRARWRRTRWKTGEIFELLGFD